MQQIALEDSQISDLSLFMHSASQRSVDGWDGALLDLEYDSILPDESRNSDSFEEVKQQVHHIRINEGQRHCHFEEISTDFENKFTKIMLHLVKSIDFSNCSFSLASLKWIAQAIQGCTSLQSVSFQNVVEPVGKGGHGLTKEELQMACIEDAANCLRLLTSHSLKVLKVNYN